MNFVAKLRSRAVLVTAVTGLVLSSGCGGGGASRTRSAMPPQVEPDPVAYTVLGANDVPKTNAGDNDPDYPAKDGVLYTRKDTNGNQIPVTIALSCGAPASRQLDVIIDAKGVGTKEYSLLNKATSDTIDPQTGRITMAPGVATAPGLATTCPLGESNPSISVKTYSNGKTATSVPVMYKRLNF